MGILILGLTLLAAMGLFVANYDVKAELTKLRAWFDGSAVGGYTFLVLCGLTVAISCLVGS